MIAGLEGVVTQIEPDAVVVDVHGVHYLVHVPSTLLQGDEIRTGSSVFLRTHQVVREDAIALYGFLHAGDVAWFRTLLGVSRVGPRVALAMLSRFGGDELMDIVQREDVGALSSVPGIGRKTASRILLDLRGKLPAPGEGSGGLPRNEDVELIEALESLGYSRTEAAIAAGGSNIDRGVDLEGRLLSALRELSSPG